MQKPACAALLACIVLLAGCADSSGDGSDGSAAGAAASGGSATMTSTGPPPKPVVYSNVLHFLTPPDMALALPAGGSEISTPTDTGFNGPGGGGGRGSPQSQWTYKMAGNASVNAAEVHVWIQITDTLVPPAPNPFNGGTTCVWFVSVRLGGDSDPAFSCLSEAPGPISPGTKELQFSLLGLDAELEQNETVTVQFSRNAFSASPNNSVFVLSGTPDHDSRMVLPGLKEAVPA